MTTFRKILCLILLLCNTLQAITRDVEKYVTYRPEYPSELFTTLAEKLNLSHQECLVDLGCGSGQLTIPMSRYFKKVLAIDMDRGMIEKAQQQGYQKDIQNIQWHVNSAEGAVAHLDGPVDLITIATAFHWMDRKAVLEQSYRSLKNGGGIVILCAASWWTSETPWQKEIIMAVKSYLGENQPYYPPAYVHNSSHAPLLKEAGFVHLESMVVATPKEWTLEKVLGYLYSTAYCAPGHFGDRLAEFEREVSDIFNKNNPSGVALEDFPFHILVGRKNSL
ncbi:MAG: class I SAM-dependent methyltransferase [Chlamydiales bacterium]|nr:class I SAM-dependent methyltransferase [Chlamydiales bacterium]